MQIFFLIGVIFCDHFDSSLKISLKALCSNDSEQKGACFGHHTRKFSSNEEVFKSILAAINEKISGIEGHLGAVKSGLLEIRNSPQKALGADGLLKEILTTTRNLYLGPGGDENLQTFIQGIDNPATLEEINQQMLEDISAMLPVPGSIHDSHHVLLLKKLNLIQMAKAIIEDMPSPDQQAYIGELSALAYIFDQQRGRGRAQTLEQIREFNAQLRQRYADMGVAMRENIARKVADIGEFIAMADVELKNGTQGDLVTFEAQFKLILQEIERLQKNKSLQFQSQLFESICSFELAITPNILSLLDMNELIVNYNAGSEDQVGSVLWNIKKVTQNTAIGPLASDMTMSPQQKFSKRKELRKKSSCAEIPSFECSQEPSLPSSGPKN